jgi:hypothetical protein
MNDLSTRSAIGSPSDVLARIMTPEFFNWEDPEEYQALRRGMLAELEPRTPYETALAENLVRYEWDIARLKYFWDTAVLAKFRDLALRAMLTGDPSSYLRESDIKEPDRALVRDLVSPDPEVRRQAEVAYKKRSVWAPEDLFGLAYIGTNTGKIEDRIADIERRRRILRADCAELKAKTRLSLVADAEVVSSTDDN